MLEIVESVFIAVTIVYPIVWFISKCKVRNDAINNGDRSNFPY